MIIPTSEIRIPSKKVQTATSELNLKGRRTRTKVHLSNLKSKQPVSDASASERLYWLLPTNYTKNKAHEIREMTLMIYTADLEGSSITKLICKIETCLKTRKQVYSTFLDLDLKKPKNQDKRQKSLINNVTSFRRERQRAAKLVSFPELHEEQQYLQPYPHFATTLRTTEKSC